MLLSSADVKFTASQCAVLKQVGVDTTGLCPQGKQPRPTKKRYQ
jgi:hypothetical protein